MLGLRYSDPSNENDRKLAEGAAELVEAGALAGGADVTRNYL